MMMSSAVVSGRHPGEWEVYSTFQLISTSESSSWSELLSTAPKAWLSSMGADTSGIPVNGANFGRMAVGGLVRGFLGRLRKLTSEVGGKVYLTKVTDDLEDVYGDIEEELRSQYLISYYAQDFGGNRWRRVMVEVDEAGAEARTLSGYFR